MHPSACPRLASKYPERVTALIVQNGNAYNQGLEQFWDPIKAYSRQEIDGARSNPLADLPCGHEVAVFQRREGRVTGES